ncbi:leucine-rich repeat protein [Perkinsela sp. CCAP 1560/4]|nr:leucine-rich repeat protein [Perkinsela sp. CCAP 1560/4]|eukprot:KNH03804.1 leucine-rich repeat protein [Perkinsela sp. CCAP 1560/4]
MILGAHYIWLLVIVIYLFGTCAFFLHPMWSGTPSPEAENNDATTYESLNDQQRMERLVEHVQRADQFADLTGEYLPVCMWPNVECDGNQNVVEINWNAVWSKVYLQDSLMDLWWLPSKLQIFDIGYSQVVGVFFAARLPRTLREFIINACMFQGTIDWPSLPENLEILDVSNTQMRGGIQFDKLPPSLKQLRIQNTDFDDFSGSSKSTLTVVGISELKRRVSARKRVDADDSFVLE